MAARIVWLLACIGAALVPAFGPARMREAPPMAFPGWPASLDGMPLDEQPLTSGEIRFLEEMPGRIGRFRSGDREIVLRWVVEATRNLHPSSDCYRAAGYTVEPRAAVRGDDGALWSSWRVEREGQALLVRERLYNSRGESWTDVPSWYWSAWRHPDAGPWWCATIAEMEK